MNVRAHVFLTGTVQGVFFRSSTRSQARIHKVRGWIKNLPDGRVESVMEGEKSEVESLIEFCKKGPSGSRIENVEIEWERPSHSFSGFEIRAD